MTKKKNPNPMPLYPTKPYEPRLTRTDEWLKSVETQTVEETLCEIYGSDWVEQKKAIEEQLRKHNLSEHQVRLTSRDEWSAFDDCRSGSHLELCAIKTIPNPNYPAYKKSAEKERAEYDAKIANYKTDLAKYKEELKTYDERMAKYFNEKVKAKQKK